MRPGGGRGHAARHLPEVRGRGSRPGGQSRAAQHLYPQSGAQGGGGRDEGQPARSGVGLSPTEASDPPGEEVEGEDAALDANMLPDLEQVAKERQRRKG